MKVLFFVNTNKALIGFRYELLKVLRNNGIEITAIAPSVGMTPEIETKMKEIGVKLVLISMKKSSISPIKDIFTIIQIAKIFRKEKPNAVFSFMIKPVIYGSITAKLCGVKYIQAMIEGLGYSFGNATFKQRILKIVATNLYRIAALCANRIYVLNNDDKAFFEEKIVSAKKIKRIFGIGIDTEKFQPTLPDTTQFSFLFIGRLLIDKGIREFITAAKIISEKYPNINFNIVGTRDTNPMCISEEEIKSLQCHKNIIIHGHQSDVRPFLKNCTALVLPSYREGMPVSVSEALSSARPVIVADVPGSRELVLNPQKNDTSDFWEGDNGILAKSHSAEAIAKAMEFLIENPTKIKPMGIAGRKFAEQALDKNIINNILLNDLKDALM